MPTLEENKKWFREAKMGMMIHWGLYSILGGEYKGQRIKTIGEWAMHRYQIPLKEYEALAGIFNPIYFDAEEWVMLAKDAVWNIWSLQVSTTRAFAFSGRRLTAIIRWTEHPSKEILLPSLRRLAENTA